MAEEIKNNQELRLAKAIEMIQGISEKPIFRQIALMVGIAASVALGAAVILWSQTTDYSVLYQNIAEEKLQEVSETLKQHDIEFTMDPVTGRVMVATEQLNEARMKLSLLGIQKVEPQGFDILEKEQGFGTSQFIQSARYHKAMEEELALSIASMKQVKSARVHLAIPKQSVFIRDKKSPTASVVLQLLSGRSLSKKQVDAIANMVASSIEGMEVENVTIVDHTGHLLTNDDEDDPLGLNDKQMKYTQKLEDTYNQRIRNILTPFLGKNGFSVQVKADLDFNRKEVTSEQYNPDLSAVRSKQQLVEKSVGPYNMGVPGALSNQPPGGSIVPEVANPANGKGKQPSRSRETLTENYEVDKSISHVSYSTGTINNISIAVVVDDKRIIGEDGNVTVSPRSEEDLQRIAALVKEAVGYNVQRGDTVNVINAPFVAPEDLEPLPETPIWERPWFMSVVKQVLAGLFVLYLMFGIIKPAFKNLSKPYGEVVGADGKAIVQAYDADGNPIQTYDAEGNPIPISADGGLLGTTGLEDQRELDENGNPIPTADEKFQLELEMARKLIVDDPKVAAQVIKNWVKADE